jgi:2-polyprenyl-6-methoxyphenol hydroxylase-like FAD-dependent oxidoreductase
VPVLHDVVIAGGGPVGLFLACELRLAGLSAVVLEQADETRTNFGMRVLSVPTIEAFYRRGMLDDVLAARRPSGNSSGKGFPAGAQKREKRPGGRFAGIRVSYLNIGPSNLPFCLPSPAAGGISVDMESLQSVLSARASAMGVDVRRRVRVGDLSQSDNEVLIQAGVETVRGRWLIGCDGGRSTVRKAGGFEFLGTDPEFTGYSVEVELANPDELRSGLHYTAKGVYTFAPPGTISMIDFDGGVLHGSQPITLEHVQRVLRRISGTDVTLISLMLKTTWTDRAYQATDYRKGRVLLAGDAAHIHSPFGGPGLNLGLGDAMNLGWKLASTILGYAPDSLLDSYRIERHPVAAKVLDWSRAQVTLMRPTRSSRALKAIIRDLLHTPDGERYFAERVSGISLRYDLGGSSSLVGRSVPDFELADGTRVGELLRKGTALLLDFDPRASLQSFAKRWCSRIVYIGRAAKDRLGLNAVLVRPDGFVAWASDAIPDLEEAAQVAARWFGEGKRIGES